ncbi:TetR/AcrR family transcriptional regulator [Sphingomonas qomolangmaensis]|uniref:TetR/AcrR family transcriptional regulator n=1 Tax=Sphingomonas qomolangmaensis TaxID=2918765 RepID=A0ABY5L6I2_9SPHN|nr:TetR/AcrR family transcriptional regulator [Sphingomonas qomolangmaensis]UUL81424.1 TetR/AcrR family transcriptional regulator [Sphingomonas qomolangmaensis]
MQRLTNTKPEAAKRRRGGRPPADQAGDVDRRILDAATDQFVRLGYDATSCDQVVAQAGAGKASLYARYANKEALFAAVVRRMVDDTLVPTAVVPWHLSVQDRLRAVGHSLLEHALTPQAIALMRVVVTTGHRMPDLARLVDRIGRDGGVACVAQAIAGADAAPDRIEQASTVAGRFIDMVFVPHQMRALIGDDREQLDSTASRRIDDAIDLLTRAGWLRTIEAS